MLVQGIIVWLKADETQNERGQYTPLGSRVEGDHEIAAVIQWLHLPLCSVLCPPPLTVTARYLTEHMSHITACTHSTGHRLLCELPVTLFLGP